MFSAAEAARFLDEAHRARARYQNLPEAIAPKTFDEAYAAQEALCALWEPRLGPIAGRKIAVTTKVMQELMGIDHPCGGMIFASRVHRSPARIAKADFVNVRIECELAVRLGRDLPKGPQPYTRESVRAAVSRGHGGVRADRGPQRRLQVQQGPVADRRQRLERRHRHRRGEGAAGRLRSQRHSRRLLKRNGKEKATGKTDDPMGALAWVANLAAEHGRPMTAGMVVITGSVLATVDIAPGERLDFTLDGVGETSMTAA